MQTSTRSLGCQEAGSTPFLLEQQALKGTYPRNRTRPHPRQQCSMDAPDSEEWLENANVSSAATGPLPRAEGLLLVEGPGRTKSTTSSEDRDVAPALTLG